MIIGVVNNLFPPYGRDSGAEIIAQKNVAALKAAGHEVFIISTKPKNIKIDDTVDHYYLASSYDTLGRRSTLWKLSWHLGQIILPWHRGKLKQILKERKPDLVITHNLIGLSLTLPRLLSRYHIRHEHVLHDIQLLHPSGLMYWQQEHIIETPLAHIYQSFTRRALMHAAKIISPSHWLLSTHETCGFFTYQEKCVTPNFNLERRPAKPAGKPCRFVFTGQLEKHKGLKILLAAWREAALPVASARLTIAGGGSLENDIKQAATEIDNLDYVGRLDRDGINRLLNEADVVIVPSLVYENSPTSLWEAAAHGCRGLASDIGGIPELSPFLDLTLFRTGDSHALAAAIGNLA